MNGLAKLQLVKLSHHRDTALQVNKLICMQDTGNKIYQCYNYLTNAGCMKLKVGSLFAMSFSTSQAIVNLPCILQCLIKKARHIN